MRIAASTIWKVLKRLGLSRRPKSERQSFRRYEWSRPGALLQHGRQAPGALRCRRPPRHRREKERNRGVGYDRLHVVVDDHSRLAYVELHRREDAETLERALAWFSEQGLAAPEAMMTNNAPVYVRSRRFRELLARHGLRHVRAPRYTPRSNGKAERFIETLQNEWAYARRRENSTERAKALSSFLRYYNRARPHSSLGNRPPISRVHNVCG